MVYGQDDYPSGAADARWDERPVPAVDAVSDVTGRSADGAPAGTGVGGSAALSGGQPERSSLVSNLERLKHNLYIAPDDPHYWQKKLRYQGNDFQALFNMAELLEREGKLEQALALYRRAERAAKGESQFVRAVYRRKMIERQMTYDFMAPSGALNSFAYGSGWGGGGRFDAAQTDGKPLPTMGSGGEGEVPPAGVPPLPTVVSPGRPAGIQRYAACPAPDAWGRRSSPRFAASWASASAGAVPVYTLRRSEGSVRWWFGLSGLLFGLLLGLLAALWLLHYTIDIHVYHHPKTGPLPENGAGETAGAGFGASAHQLAYPLSGGKLSEGPDIPSDGRPGVPDGPSEPVPGGATEPFGAAWWAGELGLTYLRTALLGYYRLNGTFPERLEELAGPFPDNYITGIPPDPVFGERKVVAQGDGTGGWVYVKPAVEAIRAEETAEGEDTPLADDYRLADRRLAGAYDPVLLEAVARAVRPNWTVPVPDGNAAVAEPSWRERWERWLLWLRSVSGRLSPQWAVSGAPAVGLSTEGGAAAMAFHPLKVLVFPDERRIVLASGTNRLLDVPAAVGQPETPTPQGEFVVRRRVWQPLAESSRSGLDAAAAEGVVDAADGIRRPYGVAGLEFADGYAIHGTDDGSSIGRAVTNGCLRVDNRAMEWLFAWTPLGTEVVIADAGGTIGGVGRDEEVVQAFLRHFRTADSVPSAFDGWAAVLQPRPEERDVLTGYAWKG